MKSLASEDIVIPAAFTPEEEAKRSRDIETSERLQGKLMAIDLVSD